MRPLLSAAKRHCCLQDSVDYICPFLREASIGRSFAVTSESCVTVPIFDFPVIESALVNTKLVHIIQHVSVSYFTWSPIDADLLSIFSLFALQFLLHHTISNLIEFDVFVPSHSCPSL